MTAKRLSIGVLVLVLLALLGVGISQLGGNSIEAPKKLTPAQMSARLAGSPPQLASLHAQADQLLGGGLGALRARLRALAHEPIVINKWASSCEPCRAEFGVFQHVSTNLGRQVAFIGIDSGDASEAPARAFLRSFPVSYPSYYDRSGAVGAKITDSTFTPVTVMYNRAGSLYIHQGPYPSIAKLERDVRRYAMSG